MKRILSLITERYFLTLLSDFYRILFIFLQSFIITVLFIMVFRNSQNTSTFKLLLVVTSIWLGLINSCQEIVKERELFRIEKRFGVKAGYFVFSRMFIIGLISLLQTLFMVLGLYLFTEVEFSLLGYLFILFSTSLSSSALGLLISSLSAGTSQALAIAPIITIPQILFNNILIKGSPLGFVEFIKGLMISNWAILSLEKLENNLDIKLILYIIIIISYGALYFAFSSLFVDFRNR